MNEVTVVSIQNFQNEVHYGEGQSFRIDEPASAGGDDTGPDPYTLLLAALGGCISMTAMSYARRKGWPLERVQVHLQQQRVHAEDCKNCEGADAYLHRIEHRLELEGDLSDEQRARIRQIAARCPVGRTLTSKIVIEDAESQTEAPAAE